MRLFAYAFLRLSSTQRTLFGRVPEARDDVLVGYTIDYLEVDDERIAHVSGATTHPILRATGNRLDKVVGRLLEISELELEAADELEARGYTRREVELVSGTRAWVYVLA